MDYFEKYLAAFPDSPSLVLVRSVELKNFPKEFLIPPTLDLCCGDGVFSATLGLKDIYGCDISKESVQKAKKTGVYKSLVVCDARVLPYMDSSFGSVFSNCALEHIDNVELVLSEVRRILRNGGYFIFTVPSDLLINVFPVKLFFSFIGMKKVGEIILDSYNKKQTHKNIWNSEKWENLLNSLGFKIVKKYWLFDEGSYKVASFFDWLSTMRIYNILIFLLKKITPTEIRRIFWRKLLRKYYLSSRTLKKGGELVIVARNKKIDR